MKRLAVMAVVVLVGWGAGIARAAETPDAKPAKDDKSATHKVQPEPLKVEVELTGNFEAVHMKPVVLHPDSWSAFTVLRAVPHGAEVKKGETLVWFDTEQIDEQLADLRAAVKLGTLSERIAATELQITQATNPLDFAAAERAKRIADEELAYFLKTDRPHDEESAKFSLRSSQQSLEYALEELKQLEKMYKADDLTEETEEIVLKRARNDADRARFYLKSTELRTQRTLATELPRREVEVQEAARRADLALSKAKGTLPAQLEKEKLEYEKLKITNQRTAEKLKQLEQDRQQMEVGAPMDGYVYYGECKRGKWSGLDADSGSLQRGSKVAPHDVFMTIIQPRPMRIRAEVPEKELADLQPGLKGTASPTGYPTWELPVTYQGTSPFPVSAGTFDGRLEVKLGDQEHALVPGMTCKVTLLVYRKADALTVPASAVFEDPADGKQDLVYVQTGDGQNTPRKIKIGRKTEKRWEVLAGLTAGDEILLEKPEAK